MNSVTPFNIVQINLIIISTKVNLNFNKGLSLKSLGRYNEAIQCYDQALNYCFENEKDVVYYHKGMRHEVK